MNIQNYTTRGAMVDNCGLDTYVNNSVIVIDDTSTTTSMVWTSPLCTSLATCLPTTVDRTSASTTTRYQSSTFVKLSFTNGVPDVVT